MPHATNGDGSNGAEVAALRDEVAALRDLVDKRDSSAMLPWRSLVGFLKLLGMVTSIVAPLVLLAWYLLNLQIASAETRMELQVERETPHAVDAQLNMRVGALATREQMATQIQHLADVDRRLDGIDQKLDKLLERRSR